MTASLALAGCGGSSHLSTSASSPVGGPSGRGHAQRVSSHGAPPPGSPTPSAAARTFLKGWLLFEYGHAKAAVLKDATPTLTAAIADYPPPPAPTFRHISGRLVSLTMMRRGSSWRGLAHMTDGRGDTFDETVQLIQTGGRWLVDLLSGQT